VTVDRFLGKVTIRQESLNLLQRVQPKAPPPSYRNLHRFRGETLAYHAVRGYWIVRLLEKTNPGWTQELLSLRRAPREIERLLAEAVHLPPGRLWTEIDDLVVEQLTPSRSGAA
jgi:hypothetical protein